MRLVLDGVFNHCGRGLGLPSPRGKRSGLSLPGLVPCAPLAGAALSGRGRGLWLRLLVGRTDLPKFNHANPAVRDHLLEVGRFWLERGIDGWRLDVPAEVPAEFWVDFRRVVRDVNPDAWIVGEIWGDARAWLQGEHFDGVMNYRPAGAASAGWQEIGCVRVIAIRNIRSTPSAARRCSRSSHHDRVVSASREPSSDEPVGQPRCPRACSLNGDVKAPSLLCYCFSFSQVLLRVLRHRSGTGRWP